jgi:streptomycin 6-kinase
VIEVPVQLRWWRDRPGGAEWLAALPSIVAAASERWSLRLGAVFESPRMIGFVAAAEMNDGTPVVLKVNAPERESAEEADALAHWNGDGAVRLLAQAADSRALLLERCIPGAPLWDVDDESATEIAASLLRQLRRKPPAQHPFASLADEAQRWVAELPETYERLGRPFERTLLDLALGACRELAADAVDAIVLHQDLHGGNILRATRAPWLVIDPKPLVGDPAFDVASLVRDRRDTLAGPGGADIVGRRLDLLAAELGLERERMRLWSIVHALAWGVEDGDDGFDPEHIGVARLLAAAKARG